MQKDAAVKKGLELHMKNKTCFIPFPSLSRAKKTRYGCLLLVPEFIDTVFAKSSPKMGL
jgi:hypothetical protein